METKTNDDKKTTMKKDDKIDYETKIKYDGSVLSILSDDKAVKVSFKSILGIIYKPDGYELQDRDDGFITIQTHIGSVHIETGHHDRKLMKSMMKKFYES